MKRSAVKNYLIAVSDMMKTLHFLLLTLTPIKKVQFKCSLDYTCYRVDITG